jgi:hypothetical protein
MSATRIGKTVRLPKNIRDDLDRRIENGEQGRELVEWLDGLPAVRNVLNAQFGGGLVSEQNLSETPNPGGELAARLESMNCPAPSRIPSSTPEFSASGKERRPSEEL